MSRSFSFRRKLAGASLCAALGGCAGFPLSSSPTSLGGALQARAYQPSVHSWINPGASRQSLLYVTNGNGNAVYVYTYPQGRLVGTLTGFIFPLGECVNSAGDVFIVASASTSLNSTSVIYEYAHGGTSPIATLSDPDVGYGCALDPRSGDLAVSGKGLAVYKSASGEPVTYNSGGIVFFLCGYDARGNLYLSGSNGGYPDKEQLFRFAKSKGAFPQISLDVTLYAEGEFPASVQWDGKYMTVSSANAGIGGGRQYGPSYIYRLRISGNSAAVVGTSTLSSKKNTYRTGQIWIQGNRVLGSDYFRIKGGVDTWSYPNAAKVRRIVPNERGFYPFGVAVSPAASR